MKTVEKFKRAKGYFPYNRLNCLRFFRSQGCRVTIANSQDFNFGTGDFFFSVWVNSLADTGAVFTKGKTFQLLFAQDNVYSTDKWPVWKIRQAGIETITYNLYAGTQGTALTKGVWHHLVVQRKGGSDAANQLLENYQLFHNGVLQTSKAISGAGSVKFSTSNIYVTTPFTLGYSPDAAPEGPYLDGYLDEMTVGKGVWLTESEVSDMYNGGLGAPPPERVHPNLLPYWFFNNRNGDKLYDEANTYNDAKTTYYHGQLVGWTPQQLAMSGNPQSGQVAWCDSVTLQPITTI